MYLVGLVPFGLSKLLSLYLYASHRQAKAAKIATYSLIVNIIASLSLMGSMGAAGLALAGSLGGWTLFLLTAREIGSDRFIAMFRSIYALYVTLLFTLSGVVFWLLNGWLVELIRAN
jgi:putative peptidoglycan lipid II flippase